MMRDYMPDLSRVNEIAAQEAREAAAEMEVLRRLETEIERLVEMLSRLYFLVDNHWCDFSNGVHYHGLDEGDVKAAKLLDKVRALLSTHGDEYAMQADERPEFPTYVGSDGQEHAEF